MKIARRIAWFVLAAIGTWLGHEIIHNMLNRNAGPVCQFILIRNIPVISNLCRWIGHDITRIPPLPPVIGPDGAASKRAPLSTQARSHIEKRCNLPLLPHDGVQPAYNKEARMTLEQCVMSCVSNDARQTQL